jgi:hypothetical protein
VIDPAADRVLLNGKPYLLFADWEYAEDWSAEFVREVHPYIFIGEPKIPEAEWRELVRRTHGEERN